MKSQVATSLLEILLYVNWSKFIRKLLLNVSHFASYHGYVLCYFLGGTGPLLELVKENIYTSTSLLELVHIALN